MSYLTRVKTNFMDVPEEHLAIVKNTVAYYPWKVLETRLLWVGIENFNGIWKIKSTWGFFFVNGVEQDIAAIGTLIVDGAKWHWELSRHDNGGAGLQLKIKVFDKIYEGKDFFFEKGYGAIDG